MKNVLYVSANGFIGGAEKVLLDLARMHRDRGELAYFLLFKDGLLKNELEKIGCEVFVLQTKFRLSSPLSFLKATSEIRSFIRKNNFSLIHSTMAYSHLVMGASCLFMGKKMLWFQHGPVGGKLDFLASLFPVDLIVFNSHFLLKKHMSSLTLHKGCKAARIVPLPINLKEPSEKEVITARQEMGLEGKFTFGSFGRIARGKNYELVIKAFAEARLNDSRLIIMGSPTSEADRGYYQELKELSVLLKISDTVIFIEHQTNMGLYYRLLNAYVHGGVLDEGFGLTVAEAMYMGIPVISSTYGALSEFVFKNKTAYVFHSREKNAVSELKEVMHLLHSDTEQSLRLSTEAQREVRERFNQEGFRRAIEEAYESLAKSV